MAKELIIEKLRISDKQETDLINNSLANSETIFNADKKADYSFMIDDEDVSKAKVVSVEKSLFSSNLQMVDSKMPEILSWLLLLSMANKENKIENLLILLIAKNPLNIASSVKEIFYQKKITDFLTDCALGLDDENVWKGSIEATGGLIILKSKVSNENIFVYNKKSFQDYLMKFSNLQIQSSSISNQMANYDVKKYYLIRISFGFNLHL